jgi:histidyl-tRNA synthetase
MISKGLPGFRDFPPEDLALRTHIFRVWREVAARYGFEEYDGPPLEPLDLYTGKSGDEIVAQLYTFSDKGDRQVALRPEMTPTLARMVAARANGLKKPIRWFSIPQLFRYERQQRGRLREHFQLNCDLIGEAGPLADAEIIALAIDMMRGFGFGPQDVRVRVSDRRVLTDILVRRGVPEQELNDAFQVIDKAERLSKGDIKSFSVNDPIKFGPQSMNGLLDVSRIRGMDQVQSELKGSDSRGLRSLEATISALDALGLREWIDVDMAIVRGLAYYTGTVFELFDAKRSLRAICGGGRYDTLLDSLGGADLPALGFGMGDVVLGELLKDRGLHPPVNPAIDVFVASVTAEDVPDVLRLAHELRDAGIRVEYALSHSAVGKQLNLANARGARLAVVIGPDDRARAEVQLKDLGGKSQESVARSDIAMILGTRLTSHLSPLATQDPNG